MKLKTKRKFSYFVIVVMFFLGGIEYAVVLPTAWLYLSQRFDSDPYMLGMMLAAYPFSGLFSGLLMGWLSDVYKVTRLLLIVANVFLFCGSFMYFMGISAWFLVGSRLVAGLGSGVGAALFADISRTTTTEERTPVMSILMAVRELGLILGPGLNIFLEKANFYFLGYKVDSYSSPGIFSAALWFLLEVFIIFLYWDLVKLSEEEQLECVLHSTVSNERNEVPAGTEHSLLTPDCPEDDEDVRCLEREQIGRQGVEEVELRPGVNETLPYGRDYYMNEYLRPEVVCLLFTGFIAFFAQTSLETMATPLAQRYLGFGEFENSLFFCSAGFVVVVVFVVIRKLSRCVADRSLLLFGFVLETLTVTFFTWFAPSAVPGFSLYNMLCLTVGMLFDVVGLPFLVVTGTSLISKVTRQESQGVTQGLRRVTSSFAYILGPLWAGSLLDSPTRLYVNFGVTLFMFIIATVLLVGAWPRLKESRHENVERHARPSTQAALEVEAEEQTPLLQAQHSGLAIV